MHRDSEISSPGLLVLLLRLWTGPSSTRHHQLSASAHPGLALTWTSGLQDLKDFARSSGLDVVYSETPRDGNGRGFVEFETGTDLRTAVEKLDGREFKNQRVTCVAETQADTPARHDRNRSRSPGAGGSRRPYVPSFDDYRRGHPRGYSPRRDDAYRDAYRDRSPRRDYYDDRRGGYRSPPRGTRPPPPMDDYPPPPRGGRYDDPYRRDYPPPPDPYMNGRPPYDRPPPPRDFPPPERGGYRDSGYGAGRYDERSYR